MAGNTFGKLFTVTTFGESHGPALGCIVDGCPPGLPLTTGDLQRDLDRRKPGQSRYTTQRREADEVEILSGVFEGLTTGTPIGLLIRNTDQRSRDYDKIKEQFRPAHADYTYQQKYGFRDYKGGGRSSARETAMRVAAGSIAKIALAQPSFGGVRIRGYLSQLGPIELDRTGFDWDEIENNAFFWPNAAQVPELEDYMKKLSNRLDAEIAHGLMSINAVKGVEIGAGFDCVTQRGTEHRDEISSQGFYSNEAGGVLGGISTGQSITAALALKPTSSVRIPGRSVDIHGNDIEVITTGRHDPCVGIRATPIAEGMLALVLADHALRHRGQNADVQRSTPIIPADRNH